MMTGSGEKTSAGQYPSAALEGGAGSNRLSAELPASPQATETILRVGTILVALFQTAYLFLDLNFS
jgi:hypothetical protein